MSTRHAFFIATALLAPPLSHIAPDLGVTLGVTGAEAKSAPRDKGERREKEGSGKGPSARGEVRGNPSDAGGQGKGQGKGGPDKGSSTGGSSTGSSTSGSTTGSSTGGGSTTGSSTGGGGSSTGGGSSGGSTTGGSSTGGGTPSGAPASGSGASNSGGSGSGGGAIPPALPSFAGNGGSDQSYLSGSSAPLVVPRAGHDRLAPYADALLRLDRARARLAEAEADLARLSALGPAALARAFPPRAESHDRAAHQADLDRLSTAGAEWIRLSRLNPAALAREFPPLAAGDSHDAAAHQRAMRRALLMARDHDTLANLDPESLSRLYPPRQATGHDRTALRAALDAARARVAALSAEVAQAEAEAGATLLALTGGRPLTPRERAWVAAYVGG